MSKTTYGLSKTKKCQIEILLDKTCENIIVSSEVEDNTKAVQFTIACRGKYYFLSYFTYLILVRLDTHRVTVLCENRHFEEGNLAR